MGNLILTMVAKICITMAFICFALLVQLDGSPDVDPGMEDASPVPAIGEAEEGPADDVEDEAIPEDDEDDDVPKPKPRSALLPDGPPPSNLQGGYNGEEVVSEDDEDDDVPKPKPRSAPVPPSNLQGGYNDEEAVPEDDGEEVPPKPRSAVPKESARRPPGSPRNIGGGGYRSKPAPKNKAGKKPGGKGKQIPPITDPKQCTEGKKCVTNAGGKDPQGGSSGRWWNACQAYPLCVHPNYFGCYYTWGPNTFCMYG